MTAKKTKIAVIGGGIYGVTIASRLAKQGYKVELFERHNDILQAASGINQYRLHRGYHYPRSAETTLSSLEAEPIFRAEYGAALIDGNEHYYCVAAEKSLVSASQYLEVLRRHGLDYEIAELSLINPASIQLCLRVRESILDPSRLRSLCWQRLHENGVEVHCNTRVSSQHLLLYDHVINCTYASLNDLLEGQFDRQRDYQFELCEKIVVRLPTVFRQKSVVIIDGPFTCLDPVGETSFHVMGNVVHAIHASNIGKRPEIPAVFADLLNRGVISHPPLTNFGLFIEAGATFLPEIKKAEHIGSMYTIRTVLPGVEKTDARPTLVEVINSRLINVFSGKIGNCVLAADQVVRLLESNNLTTSNPN